MALYWFGGSNNWSNLGSWSNNSGNIPASPAAALPTSADDVIFDNLSHTSAYTVTVDATANCKDLTLGNPASGVLTLAGSSNTLNVYGSLNTATGMIWSMSRFLYFKAASGVVTITSNSVPIGANVYFNTGGTVRLIDDLTLNGNKEFSILSGIFDPVTNNKSVIFTGNNPTIAGAFSGTSPFYDLIRIGTANKTDVLTMGSSVAVTHSLKILGNSATNRVLVASDTIGTPRTITLTGATVDAASGNFDLRDITFATGGANLDLSGLAGTVGGGTVSGVSITGGGTLTLTPAADMYFYKASGNDNESTVGNWFTDAAHTTPGRVPLMQDTRKYINGFGAASMTLTQDMPRIGSVDWTGANNTPTWTTSTATEVYGGITLISGMTLTASTQTYTFEGRGSYGLTSAGKTWGKEIDIHCVNGVGTLTLLDALSSSSYLYQYSGTLTAAANVTASIFNSSNLTVLNMGTGLWTMTDWNNTAVWSSHSGSTVNASSSTIKFTNASTNAHPFAGAGKTYNNLWFAGGSSGASYSITGTNTFTGELYDDGTAAHSTTFPNVTTTLANFRRAAGTNVITLQRTGGSGTATVAKSGGGVVAMDYLSISNVNASPANTFYAGAHSVDGGNTTGWIFTAYPLIAPTLSTPTDTATGTVTTTTLTWTDPNTTPAESYYYIRIKPSGGAYTYYQVAAGTTSVSAATVLGSPLIAGVLYYWSVQAQGNAGSTSDSSWPTDYSFQTQSRPDNAAIIIGLNQFGTQGPSIGAM